MKFPFVTRRYAEYLEKQVEELKELNAGHVRTLYASRGLGDPFNNETSVLPKNLKPIGRKQATELLRQLEASERSVAPSVPVANAN